MEKYTISVSKLYELFDRLPSPVDTLDGEYMFQLAHMPKPVFKGQNGLDPIGEDVKLTKIEIKFKFDVESNQWQLVNDNLIIVQ